MWRFIVFGGGIIAAAAGLVAWQRPGSQVIPFAPSNRPPEAAPLCPWRQPESDLKQFFPTATGYGVETRILSGLRLKLAERLGRTPTGDENALRVYPVFRGQTVVGNVQTRRVKGEFGAIELVLAVNTNEEICGLRLQRLREPPSSASALEDAQWLHSFNGKSANNLLKLGEDIPDVPAGARNSADAIVDGTRSLLILLATSNDPHAPRAVATTHH